MTGSDARAARPLRAVPNAPVPEADAEDAALRHTLDALRRVVRVLRLTSRQAERELGISGAQLFVLERLQEGPAPSLEALAARTMTDQSSVSVVVQRLLEQGLVAREVSKADRRRVELRLTPRGARLLRQAPGTAQARLVAALRALPGPTRRGLHRGLTQLVERMGPEASPAPMFFEEEVRGSQPRRSSTGGRRRGGR